MTFEPLQLFYLAVAIVSLYKFIKFLADMGWLK